MKHNIHLHSVKSSSLKAIAWDKDNKHMYVQFHSGDVYSVQCHIHIYRELQCAESKGKYYNERIKDRYVIEKLVDGGRSEIVVATECYLALLRARKLFAARNTKNTKLRATYCIWEGCNKQENETYRQCLLLYEEGRQNHAIDATALDRAIELAKERKL